MIPQQKDLLKDVRAAGAAALKLYDGGVKIPGIVQKLRLVADELAARIRFLEDNAPDRPAPAAKAKAETKPATTAAILGKTA